MNARLWELAFAWFRAGQRDVSEVDGLSAGDLAAAEVAIAVLVPAIRGVLEGKVALGQFAPRKLTVVSATSSIGNYTRAERVQADAFGETVRQLSSNDVEITHEFSDDPRNEILVAKYARVRDPDWLRPDSPVETVARRGVLAFVGLASRLRTGARRPALAVVEYGPTRSFARDYSATPGREFRLVRFWPSPSDLTACLRAGDRIVAPTRPRRLHLPEASRRALTSALEEIDGDTRFQFEGVDVWPVVKPHLIDIVERYASFISAAAAQYAAELRRSRVQAVLVPFDTPPEARLLVRTAQQLGISTFAVNDGFKGDDFTREGMTADFALAWSTAIRDGYFRRRRDGTTFVTGNPTADRPAVQRVARRDRSRVLIGSFTFSPVDLNCRRSDSERFLENVLEGVSRARRSTTEVVLKLHPADSTACYRDVLAKYRSLPLEVVTKGDVIGMLDQFDVYISTYTTSLIEAVPLGVPVIYYRVNPQRLHAPFSSDPFMSRRTASTPDEVARLLDDPPPELTSPDERGAWSEKYLGPRDGRSVERIVEAISARTLTNG